MKHYLNYVSIPIDKGTINLKQRPRALPFLSSSRNEQAYINYYQSFIEATIRIVVQGNANNPNNYLVFKRPTNCIIEKMDGSFSFIDPTTQQELGVDISENIADESFYRAALDCCFCNRDKQILDDICPVWNGMSNFDKNYEDLTFNPNSENLDYTNSGSTCELTYKCRIPMRLLTGFAARNAFLLTRNFVTKLYFNEYSTFVEKLVLSGVDKTSFDVFEITNLDFYYDQTLLGPDEQDIFDSTLLNIPSTKIERGMTSVTVATGRENVVKFNDTLNFNPKLMVMFFTDENNNLSDLVKISPKYFKISTGGETTINPAFSIDSTNADPDYRLWSMTKQGLDQNNSPCLNYNIWKNASRFYIFSFAENFSLLDNNNYINYELRFSDDDTVDIPEKVNIHRIYLKDYLTIFESQTE